MESRELCLAADGRAWKVDGRAQALVGPGLAMPLLCLIYMHDTRGRVHIYQAKHEYLCYN